MPDYQQLKSSLAGIDQRANNHAEQMASMQQLLQLNFATLRGEPENGFDNPAMGIASGCWQCQTFYRCAGTTVPCGRVISAEHR